VTRLSTPVLIADADRPARDELAEVLRAAGYDVHAATSGAEAIALGRQVRPSVAILEIPLPGLSGYEVCRALKSEHGSSVAVLFLSGKRTEAYDRVAGLMLGGDDYVVKPYAADELLARVRRLETRARPLAAPIKENLSKRETEVLRLLAQGLAQPEIAERLAISPKTVGTHIEHILQKLGVHSRAQAVAAAFQADLAGMAS
jgi:two-component system nitrate/nitrite response regulator NarL